jgi:hypothetical protein
VFKEVLDDGSSDGSDALLTNAAAANIQDARGCASSRLPWRHGVLLR